MHLFTKDRTPLALMLLLVGHFFSIVIMLPQLGTLASKFILKFHSIVQRPLKIEIPIQLVIREG